jgi:hypothetical protein
MTRDPAALDALSRRDFLRVAVARGGRSRLRYGLREAEAGRRGGGGQAGGDAAHRPVQPLRTCL